jgi:hypothetical protein
MFCVVGVGSALYVQWLFHRCYCFLLRHVELALLGLQKLYLVLVDQLGPSGKCSRPKSQVIS